MSFCLPNRVSSKVGGLTIFILMAYFILSPPAFSSHEGYSPQNIPPQTSQQNYAVPTGTLDIPAGGDTLETLQEGQVINRQPTGLGSEDFFSKQRQEKQAEMEERARLQREEFERRMELQRATVEERLARISDERKRRIVQRLEEMVNGVNQRWSDYFDRFLNTMELVLDKIEANVIKARNQGEDLVEVDNNIEAAHAAIETARNAVAIQRQTIYSVEIEDERMIGKSLQTVLKQLRSDLFRVREQVRAAQEAVITAFRSLRSAKAESNVSVEEGESSLPEVLPTQNAKGVDTGR